MKYWPLIKSTVYFLTLLAGSVLIINPDKVPLFVIRLIGVVWFLEAINGFLNLNNENDSSHHS